MFKTDPHNGHMGLIVPAGRPGVTVLRGAGRAEERVVRVKTGKEGSGFGLGKQFEREF